MESGYVSLSGYGSGSLERFHNLPQVGPRCLHSGNLGCIYRYIYAYEWPVFTLALLNKFFQLGVMVNDADVLLYPHWSQIEEMHLCIAINSYSAVFCVSFRGLANCPIRRLGFPRE